MGQIVAEVVGGKKTARALIRSSQATDSELRAAVRQTGRRSVVIFQRVAPRDTGRLRSGIAMRADGSMVEVTATAKDPDTGYDYVGVTRFGHRVRRIHAKSGHVLRFTIGGRVLYRKSVKGYQPRGDWAERALPAVALYARGALRTAGERILKALR